MNSIKPALFRAGFFYFARVIFDYSRNKMKVYNGIPIP